jgi:hypothetical protein
MWNFKCTLSINSNLLKRSQTYFVIQAKILCFIIVRLKIRIMFQEELQIILKGELSSQVLQGINYFENFYENESDSIHCYFVS